MASLTWGQGGFIFIAALVILAAAFAREAWRDRRGRRGAGRR